MIRDALETDFDEILDCCEQFWSHTIYDEEFERDHVRSMVQMCFDCGLLAVIDVNGKIEGFLASFCGPLIGTSKVLTASELAWWVNPDFRGGYLSIKLLKHLEKKAKSIGVKYWNMVSMNSSNPLLVNSLYERMGYKHTETSYTRIL